jgi:hypothetical protein
MQKGNTSVHLIIEARSAIGMVLPGNIEVEVIFDVN